MDGIEKYNLQDIEETRFQCTKKITKKMVKELLNSQTKPFQITKINSPEDLKQLIEEL